jgi:hypothetical protein
VVPFGGGHILGALQKASTAASDYSANTCCGFGNDYGDYTGLDATNLTALPVWSDKSTADGELFIAKVAGNPPPVASISGPDTATTGQQVTFDASGSTDDGSIVAHDWDLDGNGTFETATAGVAQAAATFAAPGVYAVTVRVTDNTVLSGTATKTVTVSNPPPPPPPPPPPFGKLGKFSKVKKGAFTLSLTGCPACSATLTITTRKRFKGKRVRVGLVRFTIGPSGATKLKVKLAKAGAKLFVRLRRVPVTLTLAVRNAAGATATANRKVTLRR